MGEGGILTKRRQPDTGWRGKGVLGEGDMEAYAVVVGTQTQP